MKRKVYISIVSFLLVVAAVVGIVLKKRANDDGVGVVGDGKLYNQQELEEQRRKFPVDDSLAFVKRILKDQDLIMYEIRGVMIEDAILREDGLLAGKVYIDGDKLQRKVEFLAGKLGNGGVMLGVVEYDLSDELVRQVDWSMKDDDLAIEVLKKDVVVLMRMEYNLTGDSEYEREKIKILDELGEDIKTRKFDPQVGNKIVVGLPAIGVVE